MTVEDYQRVDAITITEKEAKYMLHALGLDNYKKATRNYFFGEDDTIKHLVELGLMKKYINKFVVTKDGVLTLQKHYNKVIKFRDWEDVYE